MTDRSRRLCAWLGIAHPIIQAPMGGATTPELVAAVSNAGGLGSLGAPYMSPQQIREAIAEIRRRTEKPFNVNIFAGGYDDQDASVDPAPMIAILARHHRALGLPPPERIDKVENPFPAQFEVVLEARPPIFSFAFGVPNAKDIKRLKERDIRIMGTATTVEEAQILAAAGVDAIVTQGSEAGAHRGTFATSFERAMIGTLALVPQIVDSIGPDMPVIAAGGIMDGRGIVAAEALGASGVQMGTAFLTTDEAGIPDIYKVALTHAREDATAITRAFSGRPARGIGNAFLEEVAEAEAKGLKIPPFPLQNAMTRPMRNAAAKAGDGERLSLWAGQGVRLTRRLPAAELLRRLIAERDHVRRELVA